MCCALHGGSLLNLWIILNGGKMTKRIILTKENVKAREWLKKMEQFKLDLMESVRTTNLESFNNLKTNQNERRKRIENKNS